MDSGAYAIIGSVLGALIVAAFALFGMWIVQRNENERAVRRLAYEAAMLEWKAVLDKQVGDGRVLEPIDFIGMHLQWAITLYEQVPIGSDGIERLNGLLKSRMARLHGMANIAAANKDAANGNASADDHAKEDINA